MSRGVLVRDLRLDRRRAGLSGPGTVSIAAIVSVLVLVSLPRLRNMALHENELDARSTALALARALPSHEEDAGTVPAIGSLVRADELARQLADFELLDGGRRLRRHGYMFEVVPLPPRLPLLAAFVPVRLAVPGLIAGPRIGIRAWPWKHGQTGSAAWIAAGEALYEHPNVPVSWEGPVPGPGLLEDWRGWRRTR